MSSKSFPPGLVGEVAEFIHDAAPRPNRTIALAGAVGLVAGIVGRAYNVSGQGLNQYVLCLGRTGAGKDAIASSIARLTAAVQRSVPGIADFRGPGELVSAPGLFKWIARLPNPAMFSIVGEFGLMLKSMASPNASPHKAELQSALLRLYSKSGYGEAFDASAYSDREKNTAVINSPSLTIIGEGVPETFYGALDRAMIASGLLPRFLIFETTAPRPYHNVNCKSAPSAQLTERLATLAAHCLSMSQRNHVHHVGITDEAAARFVEFDRWTTDEMNAVVDEVTGELWNRAHLKALKLAAAVAVGIYPFNPIITVDEAMWAIECVVEQTRALIAKFDNDETGEVIGSEGKQQNEVVRCIREYMTGEWQDSFANYGVTAEMHRDGVFTQTYLSRRLMKLPTFNLDRIGATNALVRALKSMLDGDEIREVPKNQMQSNYGRHPRGFLVSDPRRFIARKS